MAKVVNLNKFRKRKLKSEATKQADTNRRLHGRSKAEREKERLEIRKRDAVLDGAFLGERDETDAE
jgi:hypothetical protein